MDPKKIKFYYDGMAILLLAVPVLIWLFKLSGHEMTEGHDGEILFAGMEMSILAAGMAVGILYFVLKYSRFPDRIISANKRQDLPEVFDIIERLCNKLSIDVPEVCFLESSIPNAFVCKVRNKPIIVMTIPLIEILDTKELETVLAHELSHIRNHDLEFRKYGLFVRFALFLNPLVHLTEPFISRSREYLADETAAWITSAPNMLASALLKIEEYSSSYKDRRIMTAIPPEVIFFECRSYAPNFLSRSPSTEKRVNRLIFLSSQMTGSAPFCFYHYIK